MTILELGALGEFVGSIGVIATLAYLAVQIRRARVDARSALLQHRSDAVRDLWLAVATDERLAAAFGKGVEQTTGRKKPACVALEALGIEPNDAVRLERWLATNFFHRQTLYKSELEPAEREDLERQLVDMYKHGLSGVWFDVTFPEGAKHGFSDEFVTYVRGLRQARDD